MTEGDENRPPVVPEASLLDTNDHENTSAEKKMLPFHIRNRELQEMMNKEDAKQMAADIMQEYNLLFTF